MLARALGVNRRTIARALARLRAEGKVYTYRRRRCLELGLAPKPETPPPPAVIHDRTGDDVIGHLVSYQDIERNTVQDEANTPKIEVRQRTLPNKTGTGLQPVPVIANLKRENGTPGTALAEPTPAPFDTFWDETPRRTKRSEDGPPPPRTPRRHCVDAGSVAWTFKVLPPGVLKNRRQRPQEKEKAELQLDLPPERMLSREEGNEGFAAIMAMLKANLAAPKFTPFAPEAYAQALEARRRQADYREE